MSRLDDLRRQLRDLARGTPKDAPGAPTIFDSRSDIDRKAGGFGQRIVELLKKMRP